VGRPKSDIRVSIKGRDGTTCRINLVEVPNGKWIVYRDGKRRTAITPSEFGKKMAGWLRSQREFDSEMRRERRVED